MPGDFHWSTFSGPALQPEPQPSSLSPSSQWRSSSVAGSGLRGNAAPNTVTPSSCELSRLPSSLVHRPPGPSVLSGLRPQAQMFQPLKQPSGFAPLLAGQVFPGPTCLPQESCLPNSRSLNSLPSPRTMGCVSMDIQDILDTQFPKLTSGDERPSSIPVARQSATALPALSSCRMNQSLNLSAFLLI